MQKCYSTSVLYRHEEQISLGKKNMFMHCDEYHLVVVSFACSLLYLRLGKLDHLVIPERACQ